MSHNIDMSNGQANIAYLGSRDDVWHRLGQEMEPGMTLQDWAKAAGLDWTAIKVPAVANLQGPEFDHLDPATRFRVLKDRNFVVRSDNGHPLGYTSDGYQMVQPGEVLDWFKRYISVDENFQLDVAGSLKKGEIIWATASYKDKLSVVGEAHKARLLMTTTFDGSGSTINKGTMVRVVCNNTLDCALSDGSKSVVKTRHNTKFDADKVAKELANIAAGYKAYEAMAEAMVKVNMSLEDTSNFFKACLDIPFDAKKEDISGKKLADFEDLKAAYKATVREGTQPSTAWTALNAMTRYIDHDKTVRGGDSKDEARVLSTNFGSGAKLKSKAVGLLLPAGFTKTPDLIAA